MPRVQTGPVSVAGDWDGVFIRQDEAVAYAFALRSLIESLPQHVECAFLFGLARLLESADGPAERVALGVVGEDGRETTSAAFRGPAAVCRAELRNPAQRPARGS